MKQEQWERHWKNYYKILQVVPSAEPEAIKGVYYGLVKKYHSDVSPQDKNLIKDLNEAYEVLSDPERKLRYDKEWRKRSSKDADSGGTYTPPPPKKPVPVVEPTHISFTDVSPGVIQKASFIIRNIGGPYKNFSFSDPESWVWVTSYASLTTDDKLPLKVEIEAKGKGWGRSYSESIRVKLDEEETRIIITLKTRPKPVITVSHAIAGVGISVLIFIIVSIIVSNVGRKNDKHSQSSLNQIKNGLSQPPYQDLPFPQRYVEDRVNIISDTVEKGLNRYLQELEQKTSAQMIVLTINTTGSIPIETYAIELATKWKLGQKGKDNGVLVIIAKDDRTYRIEIGRGLEKILPDSFCGTVGRSYFVPNFQKGQFTDGIYQGVVVIGDKIAEDFKMSTSSSSSAPLQRPVTVNISGEWNGKVNNKPVTLKITQNGNSLSGNIVYDNVTEHLSGDITNDKVVFLRGTGYTAKGITSFSLDTFSGAISSQDGDFIRGNYTNEAGNSGTWFVKRVLVTSSPDLTSSVSKKEPIVNLLRKMKLKHLLKNGLIYATKKEALMKLCNFMQIKLIFRIRVT